MATRENISVSNAVSVGASPTLAKRGSIAEAFFAAAEKFPDEPAVISSHDQISYRELADLSRSVAAWASGREIPNGTVIALCCKRKRETLAVLLGCLKAGIVCLPLEPMDPPQWILDVCGAVGANVVLFDDASSVAGVRDSNWVDIKELLESSPVSSLARGPVCAQEPALVVFTSGSSGRPAGVELTHDNLGAYIGALNTVVGVGPADRYLHTASFSFSSSNRQILLPLLTGAAIVLADEVERTDPERLLDLSRKADVTVLDLVPSQLRLCARAGERMGRPGSGGLLPRLRLTLTASEPLPVDVAREWLDVVPRSGHRMINMYGATETSGIVASYLVTKESMGSGSTVPIGVPLPGVDVCVLDKDLHPVEIGKRGNIVVSGRTVARQRGAAARASTSGFQKLPDGEQCFVTGDCGSLRADGVLEFQGRSDDQINLRGVRLDPGLLECALRSHPEVDDAVVVQRRNDGRATVVAFVTTRDNGSPIDRASVFAHVRSLLPEKYIPQEIIAIDRFPRTRSGKVARETLRREKISATSHERAAAGLMSCTENALYEIWAAVLHRADFDVNTSFYELGGDSLRGLLLRAQVYAKFGIDVSAGQLMALPSIRGLASWLDTVKAEAVTRDENEAAQ